MKQARKDNASQSGQEDDAIFIELSKRAEDGPSRAGRLSITFPEVPTCENVFTSANN